MKRSILALGWLTFLFVSVWAGTQTPKGFLYKPDIGARGAAEKNLYDAGLDRVDARLGKEIWAGDPNYGTTLQAATTAIGSDNVILRVPSGAYSISADFTIPANITLKPERGAIFQIATTKTLTINGGFEAGLYQVFSCTGTGKVLFGAGSVSAAIPHWWHDYSSTDWTSAIEAAIKSVPNRTTGSTSTGRGRVFIPAGEYKCNFTVDRPNVTIDGAGPGVTIFDSYDPAKAVITVGNAGSTCVEYCSINHFSIGRRGLTVDAICGIRLDGCAESNFTDFNIYAITGHGVWLLASGTQANYFDHFTNFSIDWCYKAAIQSDTVSFGNNGVYFENGTIHGNDKTALTGGPSYVLNAADKLFFSNVYIQAHSGAGMYFRGAGAGFYASNSSMEYSTDGGSAVTVEFDTPLTYPLPYNFTGHMQISGNIKFSDGTIMAAGTYFYLRGPRLWQPRVLDSIYFPDAKAADYLTTGQNSTAASIYNNYGYLYLDATNGTRFPQPLNIRYSGSPTLNLTNSGSGGTTASIANVAGNLVLTPGSGFATKIVGVVEYVDNAAALAAGLTAGMLYRTGDTLKIVH